MSQQPANLRRSVQIVRRYKILVCAVTAAGLIVGLGYTFTKKPMVTSQALVVIPQNAPSVATEVVIATSEPVLAKAQPQIQPPVSLQALQSRVSAKSLTSGVLDIKAQGTSAAQAESEANAVANAYIAYVGDRHSPAGHVNVEMLQTATTATGSELGKSLGMYGVIGLILGFLIGFLAALITSRRDHRLRDLDDIAGSLRVPVLAALPVEHPTDAADWTRLLDSYEPTAVHAWRLRQTLLELGVGGQVEQDKAVGPVSAAVLSLTSDPAALALGPHLATFAASVGLPTVLIIGPQQDENATAALRTACAGWAGTSPRAAYLRTVVAGDGGQVRVPAGARLVVLVLSVDGRQPQLPETMPTTATIVAVSAGIATAEQLARVATAAVVAGRDVTGFLVADPESTDHTTGRLAPPRPARRGATHAAVQDGATPTESRR